ncbi:hypothetical protein DOTSEDRAFT_37713 [Dothistroma septosporum NZE10]|uniref:Uncharacterized protein n=1 Tax=Dothistroma septosporum (strain NZE10 / CBS 128990) TaxID=675120 RepID=N1PI47_DOTSN|nr:hypothetical protein DOTSEDRAFT_37713 [Dothistroma septosporum NZE10]
MCTDLCCSTFLKYQDEVDTTIVCELDDGVDPIFTPQNLSQKELAKAATAFRLASKALSSDAATKFWSPWLTVICTWRRSKQPAKGRYTAWQEVDRLQQKLEGMTRRELRASSLRSPHCVTVLRYSREDHPRAISQEIRARARQLITDLTSMIGVRLEDCGLVAGGITGAFDVPLLPRDHDNFPRGCRSQLSINSCVLRLLEDPTEPGVHQLKLAEILLHGSRTLSMVFRTKNAPTRTIRKPKLSTTSQRHLWGYCGEHRDASSHLWTTMQQQHGKSHTPRR